MYFLKLSTLVPSTAASIITTTRTKPTHSSTIRKKSVALGSQLLFLFACLYDDLQSIEYTIAIDNRKNL